jgi:hypothetical protein
VALFLLVVGLFAILAVQREPIEVNDGSEMVDSIAVNGIEVTTNQQ